MGEFTDEDLITAIATSTPSVRSASQIADELNVTRQAVDARLRRLHDDDRVNRVDFGRDIGWYVNPEKKTTLAGSLTAKSTQDSDFKARVLADDLNGAELLVQAGPNGYQLDAWWADDEGVRRQSNSWVNFDDEPHPDYPHDNRHTRQPIISSPEDGIIHITDPDPRAAAIGYDPSTIIVTAGDNGFDVSLEWTDEYETDHERTAFVPLVDPRDDREKYYELVE